MSVDLYALLEVHRNASARQIRSAYRRLAHAYHPDHNTQDDAADRFKRVAEAYAVLSDTSRRAVYDRYGHMTTAALTAVQDEETAFE